MLLAFRSYLTQLLLPSTQSHTKQKSKKKLKKKPSYNLRHSQHSTSFSSLGALPIRDENKKKEPDSDTSLDTDTSTSKASFSHLSHMLSKPLMAKTKKTLILDLDETLIHSTSRGTQNYDFVVEVEVDGRACLYYVYKRPHVDFFLQQVSQWFHLVVFTASVPEYAEPVLNWLDRDRCFKERYFRQVSYFSLVDSRAVLCIL